MKSSSKKEIVIQSKDIRLVSIGELLPYSKNVNRHSDEQIARLCELIRYQGFRSPLVVQAGTNLVVAGHGRLMAARELGLVSVPVTYQEFESEAQIYSFMVSDNAIAKDSWAELDISKIADEVQGFGDFNLDLLGFKDFVLGFKADADLDDKQDKPRDELNHILEVQFSNESDMIEVYDNLLSRGFIVRCK